MDVMDSALKEQRENFYRNNLSFSGLDADAQFLHLMINNLFVNPATLFCNRECLASLGNFNEKFMCEDLPLYLKATYCGFSLGIIDKYYLK